jgi:hypothetical protein
MIYEEVKHEDPIRQGDIFKGIPHIHYDPSNLFVVQEDETIKSTEHNWADIYKAGEVRVIARVEPTYAIVASQDCDTQRDDFITFFKIDKIFDVSPEWKSKFPKDKSPQNQLAWWVKQITKQAQVENKWFYLPPDKDLGLEERQAADFQSIIPVPLQFLNENKSILRVGRLNQEADEHFREKIAQYFRRYPYDGWYPLNKEEFDIYTSDPNYKDDKPRKWQE